MSAFDLLLQNIIEDSDEYYQIIFSNFDALRDNTLPAATKETRDENNFECSNCKHRCYIDNTSATLVCVNCGIVKENGVVTHDVEMENNKFTGHANNYVKPHIYDRLSHFVHIIRELMAVCQTKIPQEVIDVCVESKPESIQELRRILRFNRFSLHVCSAVRIYEMINPNYVSVQYDYDRLKILVCFFKETLHIWDLIKKKVAPHRKSFLNYPFVLIKLCDELHFKDISRDAKKIKSPIVNRTMEKYWSEIQKERKKKNMEPYLILLDRIYQSQKILKCK
jgi:hypothetical protein